MPPSLTSVVTHVIRRTTQVKKKEKQLLGELHKDYIATLFTISKLYMTTDRYQAAETVALEIVELVRPPVASRKPTRGQC